MKLSRVLTLVLLTTVVIAHPSYALFGIKTETAQKAPAQPQAQPEAAPTPPPVDEYKTKYEALAKEMDVVKADRDNLLVQTKRLFEDKNKMAGLEESTKRLEEERKKFEEERAAFAEEKSDIEKQLKEVESTKRSLIKENEHLKTEYEEVAQIADKSNAKKVVEEQKKVVKGYDAKLDEYKDEMGKTDRENKSLAAKTRDLQSKLDASVKRETVAKVKIDELNAVIEKQKKDNAEAVRRNKALERDMKSIPTKFTELARQNKELLKDTSKMHYNLGVFYTKAKEYKRAIAEFEKVIDLNPDDAYAHFNLGYIYSEYQVDRRRAITEFRQYLRLAKADDRDIDWVRKYLLTWETYEGKQPVE